MSAGKLCPGCGKDVGIWPIFSAGLPNRIWCPHCRARLRYGDTGGVLLVVLAVTAGVLATAAIVVATVVPDARRAVQALVFVSVMLGLWVPLELVIAWFLRNCRELVIAGEPPPQSRN